jgi:hypothetical protein
VSKVGSLSVLAEMMMKKCRRYQSTIRTFPMCHLKVSLIRRSLQPNVLMKDSIQKHPHRHDRLIAFSQDRTTHMHEV